MIADVAPTLWFVFLVLLAVNVGVPVEKWLLNKYFPNRGVTSLANSL